MAKVCDYITVVSIVRNSHIGSLKKPCPRPSRHPTELG